MSVERSPRLERDALDGAAQLMSVANYPLPSTYEKFVKPAMDRAVGLIATLITLPIVILIVPSIWATMGRPAIFRQRRVGRSGNTFTVYKFRTMGNTRRVRQRQFPGHDRRVNHKSKDDPRHTRVGRFLRKWSLDEIPQFWNVSLGNMSLVGPRPEIVEIVVRYEPWQHRRHAVKPGITGLWQISQRGDVPMHRATVIDLEYVDRLSFKTDAKIVLRTIPAMLRRRGH